MPFSKAELLAAICAELQAQIERIEHASRENAAAVSDEENKPEGEYDTRGLEASYIAGGQAQVAVELKQALQAVRAMPVEDWPDGRPLAVGALVRLEAGSSRAWYFLAPAAGGVEVRNNGESVTVMTPASPLGRLLAGRLPGSAITFPPGPRSRTWKIAEVR